MMETIHDIGNCTDIAQLKVKRESYRAELVKYCEANPFYTGIVMKIASDEEFLRFISLISAGTVLTTRINELEEKTND